MARQETNTTHEPEDALPGESSDRPRSDQNKPQASDPGMTEARTSDPNIVAPEPTSPPDRAVTFQTSQLSGTAAAYPFGSGGGVEQRPEIANGKKQHRHEDEQHREQEHKHHDDRHHHDKNHQGRRHKKKEKGFSAKLPSWQTLLITAALALACGVGGAWAYAALVGPSQHDQQGKGGKGEKGGKSGGEKSGGSSSDQESNSDNLKKQVEQLADGIGQLGTRIDRLNQAMQEMRQPVPQYYPGTSRIERMAPAGNEAPPVPHTLQTQLTVLQRKVEQMTDLPTRVQELERRMAELQEAIKLLAEARRDE